jgi:CubicO group peptidase (beta-lactamase class C family)
LACASLALLAFPAIAAAQARALVADAPAHGGWTASIEQSRSVVQARMDQLGIPGASVAVAVEGKIVWAEGLGWADMENRVGVTPLTRFRTASISKALTAAAVGRLVEAGRLDLDAPVQQYVPSFPEKRAGVVTTRLLGGHIAGVRHYRGLEFASDVQYNDVLAGLEIFSADPLEFAPGADYLYSTYGWNLVSAVVQQASGERFLTYMRHQVLDPLGMTGTVAEHNDSIVPFRGRQYQRGQDGRLLNAPGVNNSNKWAGGGYLSTASDLVRYGSAYLEPGFLEPETISLLWTSQRTASGEVTGYGIGWRTGVEEGRREVWHTGGAVGGSTILLIWPAEHIVVSILTNLEDAGPIAAAREIAALFAAAQR